jgi:hypothetical protein
MTTVTSVDNSKFWTNLLRKGLILYVILACFLMFRIDIDYSVPPHLSATRCVDTMPPQCLLIVS